MIGGHYVPGFDPTEAMKEMAVRALLAREWFARHGPPDAPPLPLSDNECEDFKIGGLPHLVAWYAQSLARLDYDLREHPLFNDYARGVLAEAERGELVTLHFMDRTVLAQLKERFPPRALKGLGPGLCWKPPKPHTQATARSRRSRTRAA